MAPGIGLRAGKGLAVAMLAAAALALAAAPAAAQEPPWVDPPRVIEPAPEPSPSPSPVQPPETPPPAATPSPAPEAGAGPSRPPADRPAAAPPDRRPREAAPAQPRAPRSPPATAALPATAMEQDGLDLVERYLAAWSAPNGESLRAMPGFYGDRVLFHGRVMSLPALMREKQRFARRWPLRDYRPRPGTVQVNCEPARQTCRAFALVDFEARGPGGVSSGATTLELELGFVGGLPAILTESSRVVARGELNPAEAGDDFD